MELQLEDGRMERTVRNVHHDLQILKEAAAPTPSLFRSRNWQERCVWTHSLLPPTTRRWQRCGRSWCGSRSSWRSSVANWSRRGPSPWRSEPCARRAAAWILVSPSCTPSCCMKSYTRKTRLWSSEGWRTSCLMPLHRWAENHSACWCVNLLMFKATSNPQLWWNISGTAGVQ